MVSLALAGHEGVKCYEFGVLVNFAYKFVGPSSAFRVSVFAARALNATVPSRVTLSLR